jgi:hypothetical protein
LAHGDLVWFYGVLASGSGAGPMGTAATAGTVHRAGPEGLRLVMAAPH